MSALLALARKDLRLLLRDRVGALFTFAWPLVVAVFFGIVFSGGGGGGSAMPIVVVDEDASPDSQAIVKALEDGEEVEVERAATRAEAADRVRRGRRAAYVVFPPGFGASCGRLFWGDPTRLVVGIDPSRRAEGGMLQGVLARRVMDRKARAFSDPAAMRAAVAQARQALSAPNAKEGAPPGLEEFLGHLDAWAATPGALSGGPGGGGGTFQPLAIETADVVTAREGPANGFSITFPQGILWAILGAVATFSTSLVAERTRGTLVRLVMAPLSRRDVLLGKALACFATTMGVSLVLLAIGVAVFGVQVGSPLLLAAALASAGVAFVGIMMLLAVLGRTESSAGGIGWAVLLMMSLLGGGMMPLFAMPPWMRTASLVSPVSWAILGLEGAIWRGFSAAEMALPCGVLLAVGVVGFAVGRKAFRWSDR